MTSLNAESLRKQLAGKMIGHRLLYYDEIGSTNDEAFRLGEEGAPEGTVLIAESQTSGKGRMQRVWYSPADPDYRFKSSDNTLTLNFSGTSLHPSLPAEKVIDKPNP